MVPGLEHGITIGLMEKIRQSQYTQLQVKEKGNWKFYDSIGNLIFIRKVLESLHTES